MFSNKFFHFFKGYVILIITGFNIERFLYICAKRGIKVRNPEKNEDGSLYITVSIDDFLKLKKIVRKTRVKVHIKKKMGLPILLKKYKKRYFMYTGAAFFVLIIFLSSQFIWTVEIKGVERADIAQISKVLEETGIYEGAFKRKALSSTEIKNILLNRVDNISWAWVYLKGTKAVCEIYEDSLPQQALEDGEPCNIVAVRDAIIKRIIARDGIKQAAAGDTVLAGDLLISGVIPDNEGNVGCVVEASGTVEAYTWHEKKGTYKLYYETKVPTGNAKTFRRLNIFSNKFNLFINDAIEYENCITQTKTHELKLFKDNYLGISFENETVYEVDIIREPISYDMAVYEGKCDLEEKIAKELLPGAELVGENLFHTQIDEETVEVTLTMEFIEKIGTKAPITQKDEMQYRE